jgi:hypothetical protein
MSTFVSPVALSDQERVRLADLLAGLPPTEAWWLCHMHGALLCALGLIDPPDPAYARAAVRRFADAELARRRALALLTQLDRDARTERYERRHGGDGRGDA